MLRIEVCGANASGSRPTATPSRCVVIRGHHDDGLRDKLTVTLGSTTLATYSNLNHAAGYQQHTFNVSGLAGQTVTLTFKGVEDSSLQTSFVIDDTALNVS